jgi:asparagine synthase (glutamine-hydrolysing)
VAVFGPCGVTPAGLSRLAACGVPDDVAWKWPGSYTVAEITASGITIWTDLGAAWPVYVTAADGGLYWSSSSRALAGLGGAQPDPGWLAARLLAPSVPALLETCSPFTGIRRVPAGHRATLPADGGAVRWHPVWEPRERDGQPGPPAQGRAGRRRRRADRCRVRADRRPVRRL